MLQGRKILLGITGSIAAYKSAFLTRLLVKAGAEVKTVLTPSAAEFVAPLTFATLSKNPANTDFISEGGNDWNNHVELGLWADAMLIAPASANTLAKMAQGICDNLLMAAYLSAKCPVFVAPAMDLDMFKHPSTQNNLETLEGYGNRVIPPGTGELASGLEGAGRMAEPEEIVAFLEHVLGKGPLSGKKVLITAGPTYEPIDPVRFIGNRSSGKMGIALAENAVFKGAQVILVKGPGSAQPTLPGIEMINVQTAEEMYDAAVEHFDTCDVAIMSAAVADYTPVDPAAEKIKKKLDSMTLELAKTKDILKTLGQKKNGQVLVGFALETQNEEANAAKKLTAKNADFIVLNSLKDKGAGFGHDTNKVTIIDKTGNIDYFDLKSKTAVAQDIIDKVIQMIDV